MPTVCQWNSSDVCHTLPFLKDWSTVDLQCFLNFCCTAKWFSYTYICIYLCSQRWRSYIESAKTRPGADCGSDHELLIAKFRLKLKKVGKTNRPFRYDLNQIPYDYTVEVRNRFKGLKLIDRVPDERWTEVRDIVQEMGRDPDHPHGKEMQTSKMAVWGGLTISWEWKRREKQRRKGKI